MHIERKIRQHRRDFTAIYTCAHCGHKREGSGYDDAYFHETVIPGMVCGECGETGGGPSSAPSVPAHLHL